MERFLGLFMVLAVTWVIRLMSRAAAAQAQAQKNRPTQQADAPGREENAAAPVQQRPAMQPNLPPHAVEDTGAAGEQLQQQAELAAQKAVLQEPPAGHIPSPAFVPVKSAATASPQQFDLRQAVLMSEVLGKRGGRRKIN